MYIIYEKQSTCTAAATNAINVASSRQITRMKSENSPLFRGQKTAAFALTSKTIGLELASKTTNLSLGLKDYWPWP